MMKQHTISVLVQNKFGVLSRISGLFSGRGYNIESLSVNSTNDPEISQMTIVTSGDDNIIEQIDKQLNKLIDVLKVTDLATGNFIDMLSEFDIIEIVRTGRVAISRNPGPTEDYTQL